jgi:DNA polymerase-3 subunit gamma/tau
MLALARKYRPKRFADVAVQSHVARTLQGAIARERVAHGYLLCGPRGVGKTTLARVLAMALNCERRTAGTSADGEPCGVCISCTRIWSGSASLDVVEIDAASNRGVDDARDLRERAMYAPSGEDRYKVYIVDEAHMLTREAWNTLLKILEEPPPRVVFVFATTEPQKIAQSAAPVLSRLQRFDLKRIGTPEIRDRLTSVLAAESVTATDDAIAMLARAADGSMRDALSLTDQALSLSTGTLDADTIRAALGLVPEEEYLALLDIIAERRAGDVFPAIARLADGGVDFGVLLAGLAEMLRAQLAVALCGTAPDVSDAAAAVLLAGRDRLAAGDILRMLNVISELEPRFRRSTQQRLLIETLLVRFALLDRAVELEDLLEQLDQRTEGGGPRGGGGDRAARERETRLGESRAPRVRADSPASARLATDPVPSAVDRPSPTEAGDAPQARVFPRGGSAATSGAAEPASGGVTAGSAGAIAQTLTAAIVADSPVAVMAAPPQPLDLNRLAERWDEIVERLRANGRGFVATALEDAIPVAVSASGAITIQLGTAHGGQVEVVERAAVDILSVLGADFVGATRLIVRPPEGGEASAPARRLSEEELRADKLAKLRRRDPLLGRAIDALDLELLD